MVKKQAQDNQGLNCSIHVSSNQYTCIMHVYFKDDMC